MSDYSFAVVRLDVLPQAEVERVAGVALTFLRDRLIIGEAKEDGWGPGPSYRDVLADGVVDWYVERNSDLRMDRLSYNHVTIHHEWHGFFAVEAFEAPMCPRCGAAAPEDSWYSGFDEWWADRLEPVLRCGSCAMEGPYGDWEGDRANAFGAPAVEFNNWEELDPAFVSQLRQVLGGRTSCVWSHI